MNESGNYSQVGVDVLKSNAWPLAQAEHTPFDTYTQLGIVIGTHVLPYNSKVSLQLIQLVLLA